MNIELLIQSGFRYAHSLCGNRQDAEDLVQEAWLRLSSKGEVRDRAQLFITIKHLFIDQYRRGQIVQFISMPIDELQGALDVESNTGNSESLGESVVLEKAMARLRVEEREALYLSIVEGYSAKEIGELTHKPRNTVLSLIHRAKKRLCELLNRSQSCTESTLRRKIQP